MIVALGVFGPAVGFRGSGSTALPDKITESDTSACTFGLKLHAEVSQTVMGVALREGRRDQDRVKITVRMNTGRLRREP